MTTTNSDAHSTVSSSSLKDDTRWPLMYVFLLNVAVFYCAIKTGMLVTGGVNLLLAEWQNLLPVGTSFIFTSIINELLSSEAKARLVFWRWRFPLPGSEAFTRHAERDARIDMEVLRRKCGPFPTDARDQNVLWYRLYRSVAGDAAVAHIHRKYLFTRDYAVLSFALMIVLGVSAFWTIPSYSTAWIYLGLLVLQYGVVRQAANNNGIRLVTTVLALKATD
jgi:hypothetical protein